MGAFILTVIAIALGIALAPVIIPLLGEVLVPLIYILYVVMKAVLQIVGVLLIVGILAILILMSGCAAIEPRDEWTARDTALEASYQLINAYDAHTTQRIHETPNVYERAPLTRSVLGPQPDPKETAVYFATAGLFHYLVSKALPARWRKFWLGGTVAFGAANIESNCGRGLCE